MIVYIQNMIIGDELILPLLHKNDHMQDIDIGIQRGRGPPWTLMGEK
jgi:hypothetical protein